MSVLSITEFTSFNDKRLIEKFVVHDIYIYIGKYLEHSIQLHFIQNYFFEL